MRIPRALDLALVVLAVLSAVVVVPLHLAAEHHGEEAARHEDDHHAGSDHEVVAAARPVSPPPDLRPADIAGFVELGDDDRLPLTGRRPSREDIRADIGEPDESAAPPASPRAPPTLGA